MARPRNSRRRISSRSKLAAAAAAAAVAIGSGGSAVEAFVAPSSSARHAGHPNNSPLVPPPASPALINFGRGSDVKSDLLPFACRPTSKDVSRTISKTQLNLFGKKNNDEKDGSGDAGKKSNEKNSKDDNDKEEKKVGFLQSKLENNEAYQAAKIKLVSLLPPKFLEFWSAFTEKLASIIPTLRLTLASFTVGALLATFGILYPVYTALETTSEPVMLFETILSDLDRGYVDKVDTNKLFETGISAMLRSLDPYTEFEGKTEAAELTESVQGVYGGVGLVISGAVPNDKVLLPGVVQNEAANMNNMEQQEGGASKLLPQDAIDDANNLERDDTDDIARAEFDDDAEDDEETLARKKEQRQALAKARKQGIRVVNAFEGYAYDYGMRVGDKLIAIDNKPIADGMTVEDVRNQLRGEPGTFVDVTFLREGVDGPKTVSIPRRVVQISDVKLATFMGPKEDGIGYVSLQGFSANAGREMRNAILALQRATEEHTNGEKSLQGLIIDLRGNPGGLLTSAVDVASLLVPEGSDIVSAKGRGFPGILYRSRVDPILNPETKLAVLVNKQTASAAEIVSGAVQDLDVGVIVGSDRTFGKGLVQNVEELPFDTALKYTVAKYYTPSGRCIQSTNYKEGGGLRAEDGKYQARTVADRDRATYYTKNGREVKDGGGVAVDYKVEAQKASALEVTLLRSGVYSDFAAKWSRENQLTNDLNIVDDSTYRQFQSFVMKKQKEGDIKLEAIYSGPIEQLKKALKLSGYQGTTKELEQLQANLIHEIEKDFQKYKKDIKEDISQNILARYLPESILLDIGVRSDKQVNAAVDLLRDEKQFNQLLGRTGGGGGGTNGAGSAAEGVSTAIASGKTGDNGGGGKEGFSVMFR